MHFTELLLDGYYFSLQVFAAEGLRKVFYNQAA
jgi:hypothetical protein